MKSLKEIDVRYLTEFDEKFSKLSIDQYFEYVKKMLRPDFENFKHLKLDFNAVLEGTEQKIIGIERINSFRNPETADKITFVVDHLYNEIKNNNFSIDEDKFGHLRK